MATMLLTSCKKSDFDSNFYNPDAPAISNISQMYQGLFANNIVYPVYQNLFTFLTDKVGIYSQTIAYDGGVRNLYAQNTSYQLYRWQGFYLQTLAPFREMQKYYNQMSSDQQAYYQPFMVTANIFVYDQACQMVDMFGDIPFSQANQLNADGTLVMPAYDKASDIYAQALKDLKSFSDYLKDANASDFTQLKGYLYSSSLAGSLSEWQRYCNSLILRLAMRISYEDEATAQSYIQPILNNPTNYPTIDTYDESAYLLGWLPADKNQMLNGYTNGYAAYAPGAMANQYMAPSGDPRLPVYFIQDSTGGYRGVDNTLASDAVTNGIAPSPTGNIGFARWDSTSRIMNTNFPGIIMTAAETHFIKAEAYERWGGGNAETEYNSGITESIKWWYWVNQQASAQGAGISAGYDFKILPTPSAAVISTFLANASIAYGADNHLQKIATQKWIDFNCFQSNQAWAEYRRTKYPALNFTPDITGNTTPPNRLLYPSEEASLNATNYNAVKNQDNMTTKIFWDVK